MADIVIGTSTDGNLFSAGRESLVWTGEQTGYYFFVDDTNDRLNYTKTTDGGATWGTEVEIDTQVTARFDVWYDKWTNGNTGTNIHLVFMGSSNAALEYQPFNTATDTLGTQVSITSTTSLDVTTDWRICGVSICVARGGNIYIAEVARNQAAGLYRQDFWRSTDSGASFSSRTDPFETTGSSANTDRIILMPGNETDTNDILGIFYDDSNTELSLKTYDDSGNSWGETSISTDVDLSGGTRDVSFGFSATTRHSDDATIVVGLSGYAAATADLHVWDIDTSASITAKTDVWTNDANHGLLCSIFCDQNTDDLYAMYVGDSAGTETPGFDIGVYYKKSTDGGGTWGSETTLDADATGTHRALWSGVSVGTDGGRYQPVWSEDLSSASPDEHKTNNDNSVAISGDVTVPSGASMAARFLILEEFI